MNKDNLLTTIFKNKETVDFLINFFKTKYDQEEYKNFCQEVENIGLYLDLIRKDVNDNIMPEFFFLKS